MTAPQKRRTTSRAKTQKSAKVAAAGAKASLRPRGWVRDFVSLLLLASGLFLLSSILSYVYITAQGQPSAPSHNIMGPAGHIVATLLVGSLGAVSLLPVAGLMWLAFFRTIKSEDDRPRLYSTAVVVGAGGALVVGVSALVAAVVRPSWAGSIGASIASFGQGRLGVGGTFVVTGLLCAICCAVVLQRSLGDVASGVRWVVRSGLSVLFVELPIVTARAGLVVVGLLAALLKLSVPVVGKLFFASGPYEGDEDESSLPKPKLRKNQTPTATEDEEDEEAADEDGWTLGEGDDAAGDPEPEDRRENEKVVPSEPAYERADPIIVKPKVAEVSSSPKPLRVAPEKKKKIVEREGETPPPAFDDYIAPDLKLLVQEEEQELGDDDEELRVKAEQIESKLRDFNIAGRVTQVHPGPVITLFEFEPAAGVKVGRIAALQDDLAMSLRASSIRIIAPIPKRGTVGIEVPNKHRAVVRLRDCLESESLAQSESILSVPLGKDTYGEAVVVDVAAMPHLLMAGATGTGKSVSINAILLSLLYRAHPAELGLILIDPKVLELSIYDGIPHLRVPVVTDARQAKAVLGWAVKEMERRYRYMQKFGVRNIDGYNQIVSGDHPSMAQTELFSQPTVESKEGAPEGESEGSATVEPTAPEQLRPMPKLIIVIDELADLMLTVGREIEELITRLAQKARAAGIHLIVATQRPSVDVITGLIKANFPARLSFRVTSRIDSRTILDSMGAEKLLGKGDMLFMLPGAVPLKRVHGAFVSDHEVQKVVTSLKSQCPPQYDEAIIAACEKALAEENGSGGQGGNGEGGEDDEFDPFYDKAVELVLEKGQASTSMIQRTFRIGYKRAARIIEMMEREGVVGKMDGVKPREVLAPHPARDAV
jgi:S-DNA-T family DNA segregation ATPase FtsK/SpoIIIE